MSECGFIIVARDDCNILSNELKRMSQTAELDGLARQQRQRALPSFLMGLERRGRTGLLAAR